MVKTFSRTAIGFVLAVSSLLFVAIASLVGGIHEDPQLRQWRLVKELRAAGFRLETEPWDMASTERTPSGKERLVLISDVLEYDRRDRHQPRPVPPVATPEQLRDIAGLTTLRSLTITQTPFPTRELCRLSACKELRKVALQVEQDSREGMVALASLPRLDELTIIGPLTDDDAVPLAGCRPLIVLMLSGTSVSDQTIIKIASSSPQITTIDLGETRITDTAVRAISGLPRIKFVNLDRCLNVTDAGIAELWRARTLTGLNIEGNPQLGRQAIESLTACRHLSYILVKGTSIGYNDAVELISMFDIPGFSLDPFSPRISERRK